MSAITAKSTSAMSAADRSSIFRAGSTNSGIMAASNTLRRSGDRPKPPTLWMALPGLTGRRRLIRGANRQTPRRQQKNEGNQDAPEAAFAWRDERGPEANLRRIDRGKRGAPPQPMMAWLNSPEMARHATRLGEVMRFD